MTSDGTGSTARAGGPPAAPEPSDGTESPEGSELPEGREQKRSGRRPEGPPHARKGSVFQTAKRTLSEFKEDNLTDVAAALTYYAVLSIFPALVALIALVGLVANPQTITKELTK